MSMVQYVRTDSYHRATPTNVHWKNGNYPFKYCFIVKQNKNWLNHLQGCGVSAAAENLTKTPARKQKISAISAGEIYICERETKAETWDGGGNKEAAATSLNSLLWPRLRAGTIK